MRFSFLWGKSGSPFVRCVTKFTSVSGGGRKESIHANRIAITLDRFPIETKAHRRRIVGECASRTNKDRQLRFSISCSSVRSWRNFGQRNFHTRDPTAAQCEKGSTTPPQQKNPTNFSGFFATIRRRLEQVPPSRGRRSSAAAFPFLPLSASGGECTSAQVS